MYLGLDLGTSAAKAILVDDRQAVRARAACACPVSRPAPGWVEQDPQAWIGAVRTLLAELRASAPRACGALRGLAVAGQMHSLVALGADQRPLWPAMLWNDPRGGEYCEALHRAVPDLGRITGTRATASFTAAKLLWLRHRQPAVFDRLRALVLPKDYVRLWLTGEWCTDVSDAAGTQLLDQAGRCWSAEVAAAVGLDTAVLPPLREGTELAGRLRPAVARELGLPAGITVAAGGGDTAAAALGLGCIDHGAGFVSLGTGGLAVAVQDRYASYAQFLLHGYAHCVPGRWYQMAAILNGASCLAWAAGLCGETDPGALLARAQARYQGPSRVLFLPYLQGERTPHDDTGARGALLGLDPTVDAAEVAQAVIEGVAFALRDAVDALRAAGCAPPRPGFIGGGARSSLWAQVLAQVLGEPLTCHDDPDLGPALGAARLAMVASGDHRLVAVARAPAHPRQVEPDPSLREAYERRLAQFRAAYPAARAASRS